MRRNINPQARASRSKRVADGEPRKPENPNMANAISPAAKKRVIKYEKIFIKIGYAEQREIPPFFV